MKLAATTSGKSARSPSRGPLASSSRPGTPCRTSTQASAAAPTRKFVPRTTAVRTAASGPAGRLVAVDGGAGGEDLPQDRLDRPVVEHLELTRLELEASPGLGVGRDAGRARREDADRRQEPALNRGRLARRDDDLRLGQADGEHGDHAAEDVVAHAGGMRRARRLAEPRQADIDLHAAPAEMAHVRQERED